MKLVRYQNLIGYFSFNKYEIEISLFPAEIRVSDVKIKGVETFIFCCQSNNTQQKVDGTKRVH
jgi:hypothetical protein